MVDCQTDVTLDDFVAKPDSSFRVATLTSA
jgi:hypothetical protein